MMLLRLQNLILRMVARGEPLTDIAEALCSHVDALVPGVICSVVTVDAEGAMQVLAAPSLRPEQREALSGVKIGPRAGSCGTAAYLREEVVVLDLQSDPLWAGYEILIPPGMKACWSSPIVMASGRVAGTFAFYFPESRGPHSLERAIVETCTQICALAIEHDEIQRENARLAYFDPLTGLRNRASFQIDLKQALRGGEPLGLLLIDIDRLKLTNDTAGHIVGDLLIQAVSRRVSEACSPAAAYRVGGDELAVLMHGVVDDKALEAMALRLIASAGQPADLNDHMMSPSITIGGARLETGQNAAEDLRQRADFALYHAKETTRGGFVAHTPDLGSSIARRFAAIRKVGAALDDMRMEAHYQPVLRLDTRRIVGVEALCRLRGTDGALLEAEMFSAAMSDPAIARRLTTFMVSQAAQDMRRWLDMDIGIEHVGINVSGGDFQSGALCGQIARAFEKHRVPLKNLVLEVTEEVYLGEAARSVAAPRAEGMLVALDDFGTGYASLTHLLDFPVDIIKIDRSFVGRLESDPLSAIIVEGIVGMAAKLGIRIVAEGIETEQQIARLLGFGCRLGQGYLLARPAPFDVITAMIREPAILDG
ncbi:bifunctional diguanylate cyclase/phosphodiesterase [Terrihabitans rhizophilus]|uniref:EAL domain-containing protein n=1 Tax=Terrihabitans rhizophilus TaxID=3092662 RepID=A0ABU4RSS9_9HYPH|nr:EAL domain-containing protein [Terrihabitans sp. PJ23]MDX6807238.1 EAL domain-containing protein [Terrihabitans sp. PJ23]